MTQKFTEQGMEVRLREGFMGFQQSHLVFLVLLVAFHVVQVFYFTVNHTYVEWDEIMYKIAGRYIMGEEGSASFMVTIKKGPLFAFLLGVFGYYDFLVVAFAAIGTFIILTFVLHYTFDYNSRSQKYLLMGLGLLVLSDQLRYYLVVFYTEYLAVFLVLLSIFLFVRKSKAHWVAVVCVSAFLVRYNIGILFVAYFISYLAIYKDPKGAKRFIVTGGLLVVIYFIVEAFFTGSIFYGMKLHFKVASYPSPWIIKDSLLSAFFYFITLFEVLGLPVGILFWVAVFYFLYAIFSKYKIPVSIKVSMIIIALMIITLSLVPAKSDRFLVPAIPVIIIICVWVLFEGEKSLGKFFNLHEKFILPLFGLITVLVLYSSLGNFTVFKYSELLSRTAYSFSEPRAMGSSLQRFRWRKDRDYSRIVSSNRLVHYLHSFRQRKPIYTDLWLHYVFANFGHKVISVETEEMERKTMKIKRVGVDNVPKGALFIGRYRFKDISILDEFERGGIYVGLVK